MPNAQDNAFYSGFDVTPDISYEDALQSSADAELTQAANEFDGVATALDQFASDSIRPERIAVTRVTNSLQSTADGAVEQQTAKVVGVINGLNSLTDSELTQVGSWIDSLPVPDQPPYQLPPEELPDLSQCPMVLTEPVNMDTWNPAYPGATWGYSKFNPNLIVVIQATGGEPVQITYDCSGGNGVPQPQPEPAPQPLPTPIPQPAPDWCTQLCNCLQSLDEQPAEPAWAKNLCDLIEGCTTNGEPRDWVSRLCDCVSKVSCDKLEKDIWCNCDSGEVLALEPGETPPGVESTGNIVTSDRYASPLGIGGIAESAWQLIVTFGTEGVTTLPLKCFFEKPKPQPQPKPQPGGFGVEKPECGLPPTLLLTPEELNRLFIPGGQPGPLDIGGFFGLLGKLFKGPTDFVRDTLVAALQLLAGTVGIAGTTWQKSGCNDPDIPALIGARTTLEFIERLFPGIWTEQITRLSQVINEKCPSNVPNVTDAHAAFLANQINIDQWGCWVRANGFRDDDLYRTLVANGTRPGVNDICMLLRRGIIDPADGPDRFRNVGILEQKYADEFYQLTEQRPAMSDIISFMVRDVDDPNIVAKFGLDTDFNLKFGAQLKQWATDQGVPEIVARYAWRAHWSIPSPGQLFEIYHRVGRNPDGSSIPAVYDDVVEALKQQDILPFWIPRLLAINERLPTRVDVRRGYRVGVFSRADVKEQYVRRGYSTKTADALTDFATIERNQSVGKSPWVAKFANGEINQATLRDVLAREGAAPDAIDFAVDRGRLLMEAATTKQCLKEIRHRIMLGELNEAEATAETYALTQDRDQTQELVQKWFCERNSKSKVATASQLCQFFTDGLIDSGDFFQRLVNIGYELTTARELVERCQLNLNRKLAKLEAARLAKIEAENRRIINVQKRAEKDQAAKQKATEKARATAASKREKRQKLLLEAAKALSPKAGEPIEVIYAQLKRTFNVFVRNGLASAEKIAVDSKVVAGSDSVKSVDDWKAALLDVLTEGQPD